MKEKSMADEMAMRKAIEDNREEPIRKVKEMEDLRNTIIREEALQKPDRQQLDIIRQLLENGSKRLKIS